MKAYKGFKVDNDGGIYCQPLGSASFYYEEGKTYECEVAKLCNYGFHACTLPIDVFEYYNSHKGNVEYHEVELEGVNNEGEDNSKIVGTKITIGRKVTINEMVEISIKMILDDKEKYFKDNKPYEIRKDNQYRYLCEDGTYLSEQWFDWVDNFVNGFAMVFANNKWNWLKEDGALLSEQWFDWVSDFYDDTAIVKLDNKYNYLCKYGTLLSEQWFDWVDDFSNGFAQVQLNDKGYNFLKSDGTLLSEQWFDYAYYFNNRFANVELNDKWYKLNDKGELIK